MLSRLPAPFNKRPVDLIFLDTLHHFSETLALVQRVKQRYVHVTVHVYKPQGLDSAEEFSARHGARLWETNDDLYDWVAKVEPAQRAYTELQVKAVLTGRRRSQGGKRGDLDIVEVDDSGMVKVNPLANWSFQQVREYIAQHDVPYNELLDRGYKSIGDWHSTQYVFAFFPLSPFFLFSLSPFYSLFLPLFPPLTSPSTSSILSSFFLTGPTPSCGVCFCLFVYLFICFICFWKMSTRFYFFLS